MGKERGKAHVSPFSPYTKHTHPDISDSSSPSWSAVTLMPRESAVFRIAVICCKAKGQDGCRNRGHVGEWCVEIEPITEAGVYAAA